MKNPPDFVMYVVLVKTSESDVFNPSWAAMMDGGEEFLAVPGFKNRTDANKQMRACQRMYGKGNAYVQQYGPIS